MPAFHAIKAVIFDMDGVLTDSEPLINAASVAMFKEKGLAVHPDDFRPFIGSGEDRYIGGVAGKYGFAIDLPAAKKRTYEIYLEMVSSRLEAFPGAVELVRTCRSAGVKIAVASSADHVKVHANLNRIGLPLEQWDAIVTAEDVARQKPAPEIFLVAAQKLGLPPEQCAVIEDAVNGVQAAKAAGMRCVAVAQSFPAEQLAAADVVRRNISGVTIADLIAPEISPAAPTPAIPALPDANPSGPVAARPWGLSATLGFSIVIAAAFLGAQTAVSFVFIMFVTLSGRDDLLRGAGGESGLLLALAACGSAPVAVGFTWLFAGLRRQMPVKDYLALNRVPGRKMGGWLAALLAMVALSDALRRCQEDRWSPRSC